MDPEGRFLTDDQGSPAWNQQVIYYLVPGTTRLLRKEMPRDFTANPGQLRALTPAELAAACDGQGRLLSTGVSLLRLTPQSNNLTAVLDVQFQGTSAHGGQERLARRQTILLYNE